MNPQPGPQLRDIHLPAEPGWWPPAPGWWVFALLVLIALVLLWRVWSRRRRLARARARLLHELDSLLQRHPDNAARLAELSLLLRRAGKRYAPPAHTLRDEAWLRFLDADDPARPFSTGPGRVLIDGPYRAQVAAADVDALAGLVRARLPLFVDRADV
ncbi:DUF4381 domain-containing protein [Chiayiivirga flava]|uniref:HAMP domain-containing protein n=1 Tax=Chiayiivirga flava TaxID=659595 RepID=A0A7W8D7C9_9GAMM|nr:DUF4381 domain-containing protein [Chiayiivirga flava]MBB5209306.1 HAMP domain-containing protein [Chiayiivirga flava]